MGILGKNGTQRQDIMHEQKQAMCGVKRVWCTMYILSKIDLSKGTVKKSLRRLVRYL
jgi:hypothetical protein